MQLSLFSQKTEQTTNQKSKLCQEAQKHKQLRESGFSGAEGRREEGKRFREEKCIVFTVYSPIPSTSSNSPAYKSANTF